jgi:hypothetical protein
LKWSRSSVVNLPKKIQIDAILGEEFYKLLDKLGVREGFEAGNYHCHICGDKIEVKNVLIVFPLCENDVGFICRKPECITRYKLNLPIE